MIATAKPVRAGKIGRITTVHSDEPMNLTYKLGPENKDARNKLIDIVELLPIDADTGEPPIDPETGQPWVMQMRGADIDEAAIKAYVAQEEAKLLIRIETAARNVLAKASRDAMRAKGGDILISREQGAEVRGDQ